VEHLEDLLVTKKIKLSKDKVCPPMDPEKVWDVTGNKGHFLAQAFLKF